jgi:hypothetical protein
MNTEFPPDLLRDALRVAALTAVSSARSSMSVAKTCILGVLFIVEACSQSRMAIEQG